MDNYTISRDRAQKYFLTFDQEALIQTWNLQSDATNLYVDFLGKPYSIHRQTGVVTRLWCNRQAGFEEVLSIFDFLCHEGTNKQLSGAFAPVNSLKGRPRAAGVETNFHSKTARRFDNAPQAFRQACLQLGAKPVPMGDIGFQFPVFGEMTVILKFYHSDEDFPAGLTLLWDDQTLQFLFYETVFYVAGFLLQTILEEMETCT